MSLLQEAVLHFRGRPYGWLTAAHDGQPVDVPYQPCRDKGEDDDQEECAVHVGKALHLGRSLVYPCRLRELPPGIHFTLVAFLVLRVMLVRHLLAEQHPPESFDAHDCISLIVVFRFLFDVLVQQCAPVHDEQTVGVVLRAGHPLELSGGDQLAHQDVAPPLDALPSVVGELHLGRVEPDAVAEDGEYGTRTEDVAVEAFLLEGVVLCQPRLIHQVHGFLHRVADIFVIRCQCEEVVVDFLYTSR